MIPEDTNLLIIQETTYVDTGDGVEPIEDFETAMELAIQAKIDNPGKVIIVVPGRIIISDEKTELENDSGFNSHN